eukprot:SAG11_NODE_879_length_6759_cov_5.103904_3_plen_42_part_00
MNHVTSVAVDEDVRVVDSMHEIVQNDVVFSIVPPEKLRCVR